jgi:hypothetical protein
MADDARYQDVFVVQVVRSPLVVWRICASDGSDQHALLDDFRSNYEKRPSKVRRLDAHATVIQMALSTWIQPDVAVRLARRLPRQLGEYVARLETRARAWLRAARGRIARFGDGRFSWRRS